MVGENRPFRLPITNPFPKLDQRIVPSINGHEQRPELPRNVAGRCSKILDGDLGGMPEVATDVIDQEAGYAVENVKRERSSSRVLSRGSWGLWVERVLGGRRAARL